MEKASEDRPVAINDEITIIGNYNRMFSYLYRYMTREVGPITEFVLKKYLMELSENHASVLKHVGLKKDGTIDAAAIRVNLSEISSKDKREELLLTSLNEFLYAAILAVKKTLGTEHESRVIETLKDFRPEL